MASKWKNLNQRKNKRQQRHASTMLWVLMLQRLTTRRHVCHSRSRYHFVNLPFHSCCQPFLTNHPDACVHPLICSLHSLLFHPTVHWIISFVPLWLLQLSFSPLFLEIGTSTLLHSSGILSFCKIVFSSLDKRSPVAMINLVSLL